MRVLGKSTRLRERLKLKLPLLVWCREDAEQTWEDTTHLLEATTCGGGFNLIRPVEPGRLLLLTMAMPHHLRSFDHVAPQYRVWSLVRHISVLPPDAEGITRFAFGVAFIGKHPPRSYEQDPTTSYGLRPISGKDGLWVAREEPRRTGRSALALE